MDPQVVYDQKAHQKVKDPSHHRKLIYTSGEKLPPYLILPERAIAYSVAIKVGK